MSVAWKHFLVDLEEEINSLYNLDYFQLKDISKELLFTNIGYYTYKVDCKVPYYDQEFHYIRHFTKEDFNNRKAYKYLLHNEVMDFGNELYKTCFGKE